MFCWQARLRFSEMVEPALAPRAASDRSGRLFRHLTSCPACRQELEGQRRVAALVAESAQTFSSAASPLSRDVFADQVLCAARARKASVERFAPPRPLPLAAALVLMVGAVALAHIAGGGQVGTPVSPASNQVLQSAAATAATHGAGDALDDGVVPPREIPFVVQKDLVGARRGSIPLTTYVLEPAPDVKPVMRASL